jgi:hypothetical protein
MPNSSSIDEMVVTERAAFVAFWLAKGRRWTVADVAERTGLTRQGAQSLLKIMSRVVPIYADGGVWQEAPPGEPIPGRD